MYLRHIVRKTELNHKSKNEHDKIMYINVEACNKKKLQNGYTQDTAHTDKEQKHAEYTQPRNG